MIALHVVLCVGTGIWAYLEIKRAWLARHGEHNGPAA
jgi:hypothetical protein